MSETTLGKLLDGSEQRDAVHVAIAPVVAGERMMPGYHAGLLNDGRFGTSPNPIGIIDPFLANSVNPGDHCWLVLYPNTVTSLRHEWTHPAFGDEPVSRASTARDLPEPPAGTGQSITAEDLAVLADKCGDEGDVDMQRWLLQRAKTLDVTGSEAFLQEYARECEMSYEALLEAAAEYLEHGDYHRLRFGTPSIVYSKRREFWEHYEAVTGTTVPEDDRDDTFISCSC